jgi:lipopolysaccharide export system protein LptA
MNGFFKMSVVSYFLWFTSAGSAGAASQREQATISSDLLELQNNGAKSVFRGHVVLESETYTLKARQMTQTKKTGIVQASGRVDAVWHGDKGEHYHGVGDHAIYNPKTKVADLWGHSQVTRWETAVDTNPVIATAERFRSDGIAKFIAGHQDVHVTRGPEMDVRSDEARYVDAEKALYFWGDHRVRVHYEDAKGKTDFESDRGLVTMEPRQVRLIDRVHGHIIPAR